jgi:hypothetical protein
MLMLALLAAAPPVQSRTVFPADGEERTRNIAAEPRCDPAAEEIVVCGNADPNRFRLDKMEPRYVEAPLRAQRRLGPGKVSIEAEQRALPGGVGGPAAMVRFTIPIGGKKKK